MEKYNLQCHFCPVQDNFILKRGPQKKAYFTKDDQADFAYHEEGDYRNRLCARGNFLKELTDIDCRIFQSKYDDDLVRPKKALSNLADELNRIVDEYGEDSIWLVGNGSLSLEEADLLGQLGEQLSTKYFTLDVPDDVPTAYFSNTFTIKKLEQADLVICVGDVFSLQPTLSKEILDSKYAERENQLVTIDNVAGKTTDFSKLQINASPGSVYILLREMSKMIKEDDYDKEGLEKKVGVEAQTIERLGSQIESAENCQLLVSNIGGHFSEIDRIMYYAKEIANAKENTDYSALPVSKNSRAIERVLHKRGGSSFQEAFKALESGDLNGLVMLGADPAATVPAVKDKMFDLEVIASATLVPNNLTDKSDYVIPLALGMEKTGKYLSIGERLIDIQENITPPGEAKSSSEIIRTLLKESGKKQIYLSEIVEKGRNPLEYDKPDEKDDVVETSDDYPFIFVSKNLPYHHNDGLYTRLVEWTEKFGDTRRIQIAPNIAEDLDLNDEEKVEISSKNGRAKIKVEVDESLQENIISGPIHIPKLRGLFDWTVEEEELYVPGPISVNIKPTG